jgi:hypothetical protein
VQLAGGVGAVGDKYERHADAVADGVVQGRSVEGFLDDSRGLERGPPRAQRSIDPNAIGPVQRVLTLDNADFSQVSSITKLGGNAEGAYLVDDGGGGAVVVKIAEGIDSTVMAYNLAKDFGVTTPKGRYLLLNTPSGEMLCVKAKQHSPELFAKLSKATSVTLWSLVKGKTLGTLGPAVGAEKGAIIGDANFEQIGRMLVFDAAILNEDRFKLATGQSANSGNLMVQDHAPVAIDQDFANVDKDPTSSRNDQIDDYGTYFSGKLQPLFSKPESMAGALCQKMVQEGFLMFEGQEQHILAGLISGIAILRNLLEGSNDRLPTLIAWAKTFDAKSDIDETKVRKYWESLLPK